MLIYNTFSFNNGEIMTNFVIKTAIESEANAVIDALRLAFVADPATRWVWPDAQKYLLYFSSFARAFGGKAFSNKSAHYIGNYSGAALWLPPHVDPDVDALIRLFQETTTKEAQGIVPRVLEKMGGYHPQEPHWYLPLLGVDPLYHGTGLGSALLKHAITKFDNENVPAYLESSNFRNIPLYERHGFKVLGTIQIDNFPPIVPMLREPQKQQSR
jgi:ribosomal protein S18 acetylase RimI-like enzyme